MPTLGVVHGFAPNLLTCVHPPAQPVRPYVGVYSGSGALWAFEYLGGTYVSQLATKSLTGTGLTVSSSAPWAILSTSPLIVGWQRSGKLLVWNVTANTFAGPSTFLSNAGTIASGGRDGFVYWVRTNLSTNASLWRAGTDAVQAQVTPSGQEAVTLSGGGFMLSSLFLAGTDGFVVVADSAGTDAGYVKISSAGAGVLTVDNDWLPGDVTAGDWGGWNNTAGPRVPGQSYAIGVWIAPDAYLLKVPSPASGATVLLDAADFGGENPSQCDPSPDGVSALLVSSKIAQVSLTSPQPPDWLTIEQAPPVTATPHAFFCLD